MTIGPVGVFAIVAIIVLVALVSYFIAVVISNKRIKQFESIKQALDETRQELEVGSGKLQKKKDDYDRLDAETKDLQALKGMEAALSEKVRSSTEELNLLKIEIETASVESLEKSNELSEILSKIDLYSRVDEFVDFGHFEMPDYLYDTSAKFVEKIKLVRQDQRELIKQNKAVLVPENVELATITSHSNKILKGQTKLMINTFNVNCDTLISKVSPSNFGRTLERIEKLANDLEKHAASLKCGFNIDYIKLKFEECRLQYQSSLKKKEEREEQRMIREQIREEQKAIREYEQAIAKAEKEERMYREMLKKAREELAEVSDAERRDAESKIAELELRLAEAEATEERAKSMAEQTRKGHVYIISNIGSFGEGIYKIGLTRRLEPMDRVKELGDASVPFKFDVHAMIYVEDAPALEAALHREFNSQRVNAVNYRKEFFRVNLESVKSAVGRLGGEEAEFKMTVAAEEYFETLRLQQRSQVVQLETSAA